LLVGGVDSLSVAFAAHELGKKVHAYSFCLDTNSSYDSDKAAEVAQIFKWPFTLKVVPTDNLEEDKAPKGPTTVNNALFVGSTAELSKMLKNQLTDNNNK
jgi:7-cyano-7-deazaguanine synthase in queuosine biosynthesis